MRAYLQNILVRCVVRKGIFIPVSVLQSVGTCDIMSPDVVVSWVVNPSAIRYVVFYEVPSLSPGFRDFHPYLPSESPLFSCYWPTTCSTQAGSAPPTTNTSSSTNQWQEHIYPDSVFREIGFMHAFLDPSLSHPRPPSSFPPHSQAIRVFCSARLTHARFSSLSLSLSLSLCFSFSLFLSLFSPLPLFFPLLSVFTFATFDAEDRSL